MADRDYRLDYDLWEDPSTGQRMWVPKGAVTPEGSSAHKVSPQEELDYVNKQAEEEQYSTAGGKAYSVLSGAATSIPILGGAVPKLFGVEEAMLKAKEVNPGLYTAGNVLGTLGLVAATGGAGALTKGAGLGVRVAGSALENAAISASSGINEAVLGDPNVTAQSIATHALEAGALGGGLHLAGAGLVKAWDHWMPALNKLERAESKVSEGLRDTLTGTAVAPEQFSAQLASRIESGVSDRVTKELTKNLTDMASHASTVGRDTVELLTPELSKIPATSLAPEMLAMGSTLDRLSNTAIAKTTPAVAERLSATAKLFKGLDTNSSAMDVIRRVSESKRVLSEIPEVAIRDQAIGAVDAVFKSPALGGMGEGVSALDTALARLDAAKAAVESVTSRVGSGAKAVELHSASQGVKKAATELAERGAQAAEAAETSGVTSVASKLGAAIAKKGIKKVIKSGINAVSDAAIGYGPAAAATAAGSAALGPVGGFVLGSAVKMLQKKGISKLTSAVMNLADRQSSVVNSIGLYATNLANGAKRTSTVAAAQGLTRYFNRSRAEKKKDTEARVESIRELATNPDKLQQHLSDLAGDLADHAPQTAKALAMDRTRTIMYLHSKLPIYPETMLGGEWEPSDSELSRFNIIYEAAMDPMVIMKQATHGTLSPEAVDAVRSTHPELYAVMQQAVVKAAYDHKGKMPYNSRLMASLLVGKDLDGSLKLLQGNQVALRGPSNKSDEYQAQEQAIKPSSEAASKVNLAGRLLTPSQNSSRGDRK